MESFFTEIRQNTFAFYFLIVFGAIWGIGVLWGLIFVLRHLNKRSRIIKCLRMAYYEPVKNNSYLLEYLKNSFNKKIYANLSRTVDKEPRADLLKASIKKNIFGNQFIRIEYHTKEEPKRLPTPVGRERFQRLKRSVVINRFLYYSQGGNVSYYAEITDSRSDLYWQLIQTKSFKKVKTKSYKEWIIVIEKPCKVSSKITIRRKPTGSAKFLIDTAVSLSGMPHLDSQPDIDGLLPDFQNVFTIVIDDSDDKKAHFSKNIQRKILASQECFENDIILVISPDGAWIKGSEWIQLSNLKCLLSLCHELLGIREKFV
ncbi:MAG: hypothetical protein DRH32_04525 [Deltaproteobacteria bacterium]|nr:MAG: hypothetical protein DRH32_04525 [Deltaproteobacteria bacterium]